MTREEARDIVYEGIQALLDCKDTPLTEELDLVDELGFSSLTYFSFSSESKKRAENASWNEKHAGWKR